MPGGILSVSKADTRSWMAGGSPLINHKPSWTAQVMAYLDRQDKATLGTVTFTSIAGLGVLDYLAGFELAFAFFYLFPVMIASWSLGKRAGFLAAFLCAASWQVTNFLAGQDLSDVLAIAWNILARFGIFLVVASLVLEMRDTLTREHALSRTDSLTGISNRRAFYERSNLELKKMRRTRSPLTVACIDLDNFKLVNDASGHATGDALLVEIAQGLKACLRGTDMIARLGGDEFALLLADTEQTAAETILRRLQSILLDKMRAGEWPVTFSIGTVTCQAAPLSTDDMLSLADQVMYDTKRRGKNAVRFSLYPEQT
jgi:diguanylate cyclase (GGDEF)-like protein